ncbi:MAG TPA: anthranilate phosphoribosyltransferase [Pseudonocardiaceae bacterium]|nr:anthranilate phosphoribosyltransferase [Pseudonocardiaceae bacterium]
MAQPNATPQTWPGLLGRLISGVDLTEPDTAWAMDQIMSGTATAAQVAGFAVGLRAKGETPAEIAGMASTMLAHAKRVRLTERAVDVVGTGGDQAGTVNISTMAALVTAAAGVPVVKHGARAASSRAGAADVLEVLGVAVDLSPDAVSACVTELGIAFCFAPLYHPALRHASGVRRELGVPTAFNFLGPLTNPAQPAAGLVGCANPTMAPVMAEVFAQRGTTALVVRGDDGLDELTTTTTSTVWLADGGTVRIEQVDPTRLGIPRATAGDLRGGDADENAAVVRDLVGGKTGPVRDAVLLNAAGAVAAFYGLSGDLHDDLRAGLSVVAPAIDSGAAADLLARWIALSTDLRAASAD